MSANSDPLEELEQRHRLARSDLDEKLFGRIKLVESYRPYVMVVAAVGAALLCIANFFPNSSDGTIPFHRLVLLISGCIIALLCAIILAFLEHKKLDIIVELHENRKTLEDNFILSRNFRDGIEKLNKKIIVFNENKVKFGHLLFALERMNEAAERMIAEKDIHKVIEAMMDAGLTALLDAFGFEKREYWTISIFSEEDIGGTTVMRRRIARCFDRAAEIRVPRDWEKGEGFTGAAWGKNSVRIEENTTNPDIERFYEVPHGKYDENDKKYYVSFAAIPIRVGSEDNIWGIITVTSSVAGRFTRDETDDRSFNTDVVRQIEKLIAVQVALRTP